MKMMKNPKKETMNKLSLMDIKQAIWDKRFQELFPEHKAEFEAFLKDPGCACNVKFLRTLMRQRDKLKKYFPTKEIITPEEEDAVLGKNDYVVISCPIDQLEVKLKGYPRSKRMVAAARWKDRVTVILNDINAILHVPDRSVKDHLKDAKQAEMNWKVINTTKENLINELKALPDGRKTFALTRWGDNVTLIVNDLTSLF